MSLANGPALWGLLQQFISCGGGPCCPRICLPSSKWNIMASTKDNYFHHLPCANLVNSNTVAPALAQSLLSSHLWSMIGFGHRLPTLSASLLCVGSLQTLVPKQRLLLRIKTWRNFLPQTMWAGTQSIFPFVFSGKTYWLKLSTPVSIPSYLHSSPNKCRSRQWQLLGLCHHTHALKISVLTYTMPWHSAWASWALVWLFMCHGSGLLPRTLQLLFLYAELHLANMHLIC